MAEVQSRANSSKLASHPPSREAASCPPSREGAFSQQRKRSKSVYSKKQSIKPLDMRSIKAAQNKISLNPKYINKKHDKRVPLYEKVKLTKACHRPITVPLAKIIGKIPDYVDVSELQGLRREVKMCKYCMLLMLSTITQFTELQKEYHKVVECKRYDIHRRHVELMEIDKITSDRLRKRFIETLKAYGISNNVISDVLAEVK